MADPTLLQALANAKLRPLLLSWSKRVYNDDQVGFLLDLNAKKPAKYLYETYIAETAPKLINIEAKDLKPMRELAKTGEAAFTDQRMWAALAKAGEETILLLTPAYTSANKGLGEGFLISKEYVSYVNANKEPRVGEVLNALRLTGAKATRLEPYLKFYFDARTATDAYKAYLAMQKQVSKAKLDLALNASGKTVAEVTAAYQKEKQADESKALAAENAKKAAALVATITKEVADANKYLTSALKTAKDKEKMKGQDRTAVNNMFNSGRMRVEKANATWTKAVRLDPGFAKKFSALAASKKKMDDDWHDYREALGK